MIDFSKPMRIVGSKRQVFVTGFDRWGTRLDTTQTGRNTGFLYDRTGDPLDEGCPWGAIENFDPSEGLFLPAEEVATPAMKRAQARIADENADHVLWGIF